MGAGGAAHGIILPLLAQKPAALSVANRTVERAHALQRQFAAFGPVWSGGYADLGGQVFDLVVNATSAGLAGELPALPRGVFAPGSLAYDLTYGKDSTRFLAHARAEGATQVADGLGMLVAGGRVVLPLARPAAPSGR
jgi:shikimate dehydrogenase